MIQDLLKQMEQWGDFDISYHANVNMPYRVLYWYGDVQGESYGKTLEIALWDAITALSNPEGQS